MRNGLQSHHSPRPSGTKLLIQGHPETLPVARPRGEASATLGSPREPACLRSPSRCPPTESHPPSNFHCCPTPARCCPKLHSSGQATAREEGSQTKELEAVGCCVPEILPKLVFPLMSYLGATTIQALTQNKDTSFGIVEHEC